MLAFDFVCRTPDLLRNSSFCMRLSLDLDAAKLLTMQGFNGSAGPTGPSSQAKSR